MTEADNRDNQNDVLADFLIAMSFGGQYLSRSWAVDDAQDGAVTWIKSLFSELARTRTAPETGAEDFDRASLSAAVNGLFRYYFDHAYQDVGKTAPDGRTFTRQEWNPEYADNDEFNEAVWTQAKALTEAMIPRLVTNGHNSTADNILEYYNKACSAFGDEPADFPRGGQQGWSERKPQV